MSDRRCATTDNGKAGALGKVFNSLYAKLTPGDWNVNRNLEQQSSSEMKLREQIILIELGSLDATMSLSSFCFHSPFRYLAGEEIAIILNHIWEQFVEGD